MIENLAVRGAVPREMTGVYIGPGVEHYQIPGILCSAYATRPPRSQLAVQGCILKDGADREHDDNQHRRQQGSKASPTAYRSTYRVPGTERAKLRRALYSQLSNRYICKMLCRYQLSVSAIPLMAHREGPLGGVHPQLPAGPPRGSFTQLASPHNYVCDSQCVQGLSR
jgi:hypothetical protein